MNNLFINTKYFQSFIFILFCLCFCHIISADTSYGTIMFPDTNSTYPSLKNDTKSLNSTTELTDMFVLDQEKSNEENNTDFNNLL
jgi:hypothetical protein